MLTLSLFFFFGVVALLPLGYQILVLGLREGGLCGSAPRSWVSVSLSRLLAWGAGVMTGLLVVVGGFPLAPGDAYIYSNIYIHPNIYIYIHTVYSSSWAVA